MPENYGTVGYYFMLGIAILVLIVAIQLFFNLLFPKSQKESPQDELKRLQKRIKKLKSQIRG